MITFKPGDEAKATDAISHLVNKGRQKAMYRLMGAGFKISKTTQALGTLTGTVNCSAGPEVRQVDDETVSVGFKAKLGPRTVAVLAKNAARQGRKWPRALRG